MKKTIKNIIIIIILCIVIILGFSIIKNQEKKDTNIDIKETEKEDESTKETTDESKRYLEIKNSAKRAVEWNIKARYPKCPISNEQKKVKQTSGTHYNSSFLISNGYINKEELLDIDGKSYCDVYVDIKVEYENPQDHQNNCQTSYNIFLKCNNYEDKGYVNREK